jgi:hypothetical protein
MNKDMHQSEGDPGPDPAAQHGSTDGELVQLSLDGDRAAFGRLELTRYG